MDTRGRSRSKTPFMGVEEFAKEFIEKGSHIEKTVIRSTRSTTYRTEGSTAMSTDEVTSVTDKPSRKLTRSERSAHKLYKTSDYSSEDGEGEVISSKSISQNDKNQLIEDARAAANGNSEVSALDLYKRSGRYWDIYPKTDWTYSPHSRDRVELAPGVVAMPNMSRKTIHSVHSTDNTYADFAHKQTNTETYAHRKDANAYGDYRPRQLFNNNHEYERISYARSQWLRIRRTLVTIVTTIVAVCHFAFRVQTSWLAKLHQFTSRIMLLDTWLLWKNADGNKGAKLAALCLVPLFLLGGWYITTNVSSFLYASYFNSSSIANPPAELVIAQSPPILTVPPDTDGGNKKAFQTAPGLSELQLKAIADEVRSKVREEIDVDQLVTRILQSTEFAGRLDASSLGESHEALAGELGKLKEHLVELSRLRLEDSAALAQLQRESSRNNAFFSASLTRCCRRPVINVESYVRKLLGDILNDGEYLGNQPGLNEYLQAAFAAKKDLEDKLANVTARLSSRFQSAIEESSHQLLEDVSRRITRELKSSSSSSSSHTATIADDRVEQIVRNALKVYDADKTGLVDYAMETMGGQVLSTRCTEPYRYGHAVVSVLGIPLWHPVHSPRTIITAGIRPGECWAFQNFPGFAVLRLSKRVRVEAVSVEHISRLLAPNADIDSSPKEFQVFGLRHEEDKEPVDLGEFVYDAEGEALQVFEVRTSGDAFDIVELRVLSNNGNPNYTCLYRFRVHGTCVT